MTRWRLGMIGLVVVGGALVGWRVMHGSNAAHAADSAPPPQVPVTTAGAQVRDVPVFLEGLGTVQAYNVVEMKAQVNGTLIALPAHEGQEVKKGDIIAEIDPTPYKAALDQAVAQRAEDAALLQSAQLDLKRYQNLAQKDFAPIQQVDDQQAAVNKDMASVALDNAAIETAQFNLNNCILRAPIDGRVSLYQVDAGNLIEVASQTTTGIVSITQDKPISVVFTLPEADLAQVQAARAKGAVPVQASNSQDASQVLAHRHAGDAEQHDQHDDRNDLVEGDVREPGRPSVARPVRQYAGAGQRVAEGRHRARTGGAAWAGRAVRLCCQTGPDGSAGKHPGRLSG